MPNLLLLKVFHTFIFASLTTQYLLKGLDWIGCCLLENNPSVDYLKRSDWEKRTTLSRGTLTPPVVWSLCLFSLWGIRSWIREQRSSGVPIITFRWWPSHSVFRQASHMHVSHVNVKHAQTLSNEKRIKHFATCASHLIPSSRSEHEDRVYHLCDSMRLQWNHT